MKVRLLLSLLIATALVGGCKDESPVSELPHVRVVTDASEYVQGTEVHSILMNLGDVPVYTLICAPVATLDLQRGDGSWMDLGVWWEPLCRAFPGPAYLEPGHYLTLPTLSAQTAPALEPGTYRIKALVYADGALLPDEERASEPFRLVAGAQ